jgi:hypothetical protein
LTLDVPLDKKLKSCILLCHGGFMSQFVFISIFTLLSSFGFATSPDIPVGPDHVFIQGTAPNEIKIMSYNLLNLFDADKDLFSDDWLWLPKNHPGKSDYCKQLPTAKEQSYCGQFDWTYEKVDWKLNQIKKVVAFQGSQPDMMAVMEVENENVLRLLANKLGYQHYMITSSSDKRGIDVALMFNLKPGLVYMGWEPIYVRFDSNRPGRDIMRADFTWNNHPFSLYVNHWPSQRNPVAERVSSAKTLMNDVDQMTQNKGPQWSAVAVGDFNTIDSDSPNPFRDFINNPRWNNHMYDAEAYGRQSLQNPSLPFTPPGTYYYGKDDTWSPLDRIAVTQNLIDQKDMEFAQESLRILFPQFMSFNWRRYSDASNNNNSDDGTVSSPIAESRIVRVPHRYNFDTNDETKRGFSDHLPVVFKLRQ